MSPPGSTVPPAASVTAAISYSTLRWVSRTPFGLPVVPDVYSTVTVSSGRTDATRRATASGLGGQLAHPRLGELRPAEVGLACRAGGQIAHDDPSSARAAWPAPAATGPAHAGRRAPRTGRRSPGPCRRSARGASAGRSARSPARPRAPRGALSFLYAPPPGPHDPIIVAGPPGPDPPVVISGTSRGEDTEVLSMRCADPGVPPAGRARWRDRGRRRRIQVPGT